MSERVADYTATPTEAFQGELVALRAAGPTLRVRLHFALMAKGNVQPEATIEASGIPADPVPEGALADLGLLAARVLRVATVLGKRWEWQYAHAGPPMPSENPEMGRAEADRQAWILGKAVMIADREEIEGWLVERQP